MKELFVLWCPVAATCGSAWRHDSRVVHYLKRLLSDRIQLLDTSTRHEKMQHANPVETGVRVAFTILMYQLSNLVKQELEETMKTSRSVDCRFVMIIRRVLYHELPDTFLGLNASYPKIFVI
jgi:hypothetical protein